MSYSSIRVRQLSGSQAVAVQVRLPGGSRAEQVPGQASITGRMLAEGSDRRNWRQIAEQAEDLGMSITAFGGLETIGVAIEALAQDWERAVEWAAELVLEPSFPQDRFEWLVQQNSAELCSMADQPEVKTGWEFLKQLYHPHPRSRPVQGTLEGLASLEREACLGFWRQSQSSGPLVTISGGLEGEDNVRARVESIFGSRTPSQSGQPAASPPGSDEAFRRVSIAGADQAHFYAGHLTIPRADPDLPALQILSVILGSGSGLSGRLPQRLREREGLAYSASASAAAGAGLDPGRFVIYLGTAPDSLQRAESCVREEIDRLVSKGVSEREVAEAKSYLIGRDPFRRETARQWAELLAEAEFYGDPVDQAEWCTNRWREVSRNGVEAAVRRHLRPADIKVTVGVPS
ncbi:MAG: pitrilysin family protein [Thermoanaerobaculia bacterium]